MRRKFLGPLNTIAAILVISAAARVITIVGYANAEASESAPQISAGDKKEVLDDTDQIISSIMRREAEVEAREKIQAQESLRLKAMKAEIQSGLEELKNAEDELRKLVEISNKSVAEDIDKLVTVYENMKPKDAATIFEEMQPSFAAGFVARMRPDASAAIMSGMTAETAHAISVYLAGRFSQLEVQ